MFISFRILSLLAMQTKRVLLRIYKWRVRNMNDRNFIMILSAVIGLLSGLAAVVIKNLVHLIRNILESRIELSGHFYLYIILPIVGLFLVALFVKYMLRKNVDHGIPTVLHSIAKRNGRIRTHNIFSSVIASSITVGFGGSVGLEGPTLATGAAIGSNLSRLLRLNYRQVTLMLGCAAAGAMAAIFKAPIAAIVFALEVIMINLTMTSVIPLLISSVTGAITSYFFLGQNTLYSFHIVEQFNLSMIPYYVGLGIVTGLASLYFTKVYITIAGIFEQISSRFVKILLGGTSLGLLVFLFPSLYGEGYEVINSALQGNTDYLFENTFYSHLEPSFFLIAGILVLVVLFKVVATSATFGGGGIGGVFAPSLFVGANTGLLFAKVMNYFGADLQENNFALVAMSGLITGVIHAPLTGIFLIAEITSGYALIMPLMITATISYATIRLIRQSSVYTYQLVKRGELFTHDQDKTVLSLMEVSDLIEMDFQPIAPDATLGDLVQVISKSHRNVFPVLDTEKHLLGLVWLNDIRHIVFKPELYDSTFVRDLMFMPQPSVSPGESMEEVAQKFQQSNHYNLPVLDNGIYIGFVSRANVFSKYRSLIKEFSED
ncbi:MAG: chloride channel protein [Bacteroidales bacterium]|nr:chloride channel protein [Bacteroidales bacterium]